MPKELWYGGCGYWTADWSKLANTQADRRGVPLCPGCGAPGFIADKSKWWDGAKQFEQDGHPGYVKFLRRNRERCLGRGGSMVREYDKWMERRVKGGE